MNLRRWIGAARARWQAARGRTAAGHSGCHPTPAPLKGAQPAGSPWRVPAATAIRLAAAWLTATGLTAGAAAQSAELSLDTGGTAPRPACSAGDLRVLPPAAGEVHRIGEALKLRADGGCAKQLRSLLGQGRTEPVATLVLDQVAMKGLPLEVPVQDGPDALVLSFRLARDSQDDVVRRAWDSLLAKQNQGYTMTLPVALALPGEPAVAARSGTLRLKIGDTSRILGMLAGGVVLFLGGFALLIRRTDALRDSPGGHFSLGKSQMAFWGWLIVLCFLGVFVVTGAMEKIPDQVLVLLGISGATGLGAVLIGAGKAPPQVRKAALEAQADARALSPEEQGKLDKLRQVVQRDQARAASPPPRPTLRQFFSEICDDGSGLSVHRLQVVVWTVVLGGVFVWNVAQLMSMPQFPDTLLLLLGISNGTYLGFKIPEP